MLKNCKIVIATGGFDPIHSGHIKYFEEAKKLGDYLIVGVNSDEWLINKKGKPFLNLEERMIIIENFRMVDEVVSWDDSDGTAVGAIELILKIHPMKKIIFANGGDRNKENIPEQTKFISHKNIEFAFGVGGNIKINSSSWISNNWLKK